MYTKRDNAKLVVFLLVLCVAALGVLSWPSLGVDEELDRAIQERQQQYWDCMVQQARLRRTPELCRELR